MTLDSLDDGTLRISYAAEEYDGLLETVADRIGSSSDAAQAVAAAGANGGSVVIPKHQADAVNLYLTEGLGP